VLLTAEERKILERAATEEGRCIVEGLTPAEMVHLASAFLTLQLQGLVATKIIFNDSRQPEQIYATLTEQGRRALQG